MKFHGLSRCKQRIVTNMIPVLQSRHLLGVFCMMLFHVFYRPTDSGAVQITHQNLDMTLASNEIVFINFYAEWCRFSNMLMPIFDDAADKVVKAGYTQGQVVMGKVDCDQEGSVATRFHINKYPTLKLFRNGQPAKREYRGQRSVEAFSSFIKQELADPITPFNTLEELKALPEDKRRIIGFFKNREEQEYITLRRVAHSLKDDCAFTAGFGDASAQMHPPNQPVVVFRADRKVSNDPDEKYLGSLTDFDELHKWVQEKCVPLVREITFENAEELTEEGLPFLILFHHSDDTETVKKYKDIVNKELASEKANINFLTANGQQFEHPLHHLGKSLSDLPLIAIDSFRHMYVFPEFKDMAVPGKLKQFLDDLYSGKLHRTFHYGPEHADNNAIGTDDNTIGTDKKTTTPPESTFKKLAPSKNRYTLLRDEL